MSDEKKVNSEYVDYDTGNWEEMLYARHAEIESFKDLSQQRGTSVPAIFSQFYKFVQNPSTVSLQTFKRMVDTDETIGSGVDFLTTCLTARLGNYQHKSKEITEWVNARLEDIEGGMISNVKELLSATWAGFFVGEKNWANTENGFVVKKIVPLPPVTVLFEMDREGRVTPDGILQYQRNWNPFTLNGGLGVFGGSFGTGSGFSVGSSRPDPFAKFGDLDFPARTASAYNYLSVRIPRQKCIHYAFDAQGKFGNPYGRSLLRRCYKYYVTKDAVLQMMVVALDRKGTPLTVVYADPNTTLMDPNQKQAGVSAKGQRIGMRADVAAQKAFANLHNDSVIILPGKKGEIFDTDFINQSANTDTFISAIDLCNKSILRGLLIPALIFGNGDGSGSFALGQEHARTFDKILDGILAGAKQCLLQQLVYEMIAYNFPRSAWEKDGLGDFAKREMTQEERDKELDVCQKAVDMGAIDMTDLQDMNQVREKAGFEPRDTTIIQPGDALGMDGDEESEDDGEGNKEKGKSKDAKGNERGDSGS